jgi:hypothetical protein
MNMRKRAKLERTLVLRDAALKVVRRTGVWELIKVAGQPARNIKVLSARIGSLQISYRIPFHQTPQPSDAVKYCAAQHGLTVPWNLTFGLDVWAPNKVLNIEWDDKGNYAIVSFRPGTWEAELTVLAESKVA